MQSKKINKLFFLILTILFINTELLANPKEFISKLTTDASNILAKSESKDEKC